MNLFLRFTLLCFLLFQIQLEAQNPSALYQNWVDAQVNSTEPTLPTFSYAGYHNGEVGLPSLFSQQVYDVTDVAYGAVPNDGVSDKAAIMLAIAAAEANPSGGIVFFPPGRFVVNDGSVDNLTQVILISKSNIVIKGSGSGPGGTELYQKDNTTHPDMETKDWVCPYLFLFTNGEDSLNTFITNVTGNANRETYSIEVANASGISVGQWVELYIKDTSTALVNEELAPYTTADLYQPANLKIVNDGVQVREIHKVVSKSGNIITFKEPIHRTINGTYNWKINSFKALEEVGIQDLKYTGGFIYNHIHHRAPQELYPGEAVSGPHAYLSSSGWSGIQFNHVVNGWISNVEFSDMSQVAQFKFSAYCTALNNKYTANPGHNFITTNSAAGCFLGKNIDNTSGVWHGCGVNAVSIGNVLWRNEHPQNGNSGMEIHASQPRTSLFDVCKGGFFFNQGGSTGALPNHLRHMVLWNFEGVSYQSSNVKSWRPNSETRYAKFLMPIISGLQGFTMSTSANQYQVNESQGTHVDEESLYEAQLAYRLGGLPNWITGGNAVTSVSISPTFLALNVGNTSQLVETVLPSYAADKTVSWASSNTSVATVGSNGEVTAIAPGSAVITVTTTDGNYTAICSVNVNNVALNKTVIVSTEPQPENPGTSAVDGDHVTRWSAQVFPQWLEVDFGALKNIDKTELVCLQDRAYQFIIEAKANSGDTYTQIVDRSANTEGGSLINPITDTFTAMDARYVRVTVTGANVYTGAWTSLQEFRVFESASSLSVNDLKFNKTKVYPNPFSTEISIRNLGFGFNNALLIDTLGRTILSQSINGLDEIKLAPLFTNKSSGIYILKLVGDKNIETHKLVRK